MDEGELEGVGRSYVEMERSAHLDTTATHPSGTANEGPTASLTKAMGKLSLQQRDEAEGRVVDVVLSDMCEPWPQTTGTWIKSVSDPYRRMMNTSGIGFKDHAGSMVRFHPASILPPPQSHRIRANQSRL